MLPLSRMVHGTATFYVCVWGTQLEIHEVKHLLRCVPLTGKCTICVHTGSLFDPSFVPPPPSCNPPRNGGYRVCICSWGKGGLHCTQHVSGVRLIVLKHGNHKKHCFLVLVLTILLVCAS